MAYATKIYPLVPLVAIVFLELRTKACLAKGIVDTIHLLMPLGRAQLMSLPFSMVTSARKHIPHGPTLGSLLGEMRGTGQVTGTLSQSQEGCPHMSSQVLFWGSVTP
jgi:hypothetical protein